MGVVATAAAIVDRGTSEIHSSRDRDAHGKTARGVCLRGWNDGYGVIIDESRWPGGWILRGIDERVIVRPGALVVGIAKILVLLVGRSEGKGKGVIYYLNGSFADTDVFADANFDALICEGTGQGGRLLGDE